VRLSGRLGEDDACAFLRRAGYRVLQRNFRCPAGEVDVVATDGKTTAFVEIKARRAASRVGPKEAVTAAKQRKIGAVAGWWAASKRKAGPMRFDVLAVTYGDGKPSFELIKGAFDLSEP